MAADTRAPGEPFDAKGNSYMADKAQLKHNLGTHGANADYAAHDVKDWKQPQRKEEGPVGNGLRASSGHNDVCLLC
jgi:hypothetical protein